MPYLVAGARTQRETADLDLVLAVTARSRQTGTSPAERTSS